MKAGQGSEHRQVLCGRRNEAGLELRASSSTLWLPNLRQVTSFTQASGSFTCKVGGISYLQCFPSPPLPRPTVGREYSPYAIDDGRSHTTWFGQWNVHGSDNGHVPVSSAMRKAHRGELLVQEQGDTWGSSGRGPQPDAQQYQPMGRPMSTDTKCLHPGLETPGACVHGRMDKEDTCTHSGVLLSRKKGRGKSCRFQPPGGLGGCYAK